STSAPSILGACLRRGRCRLCRGGAGTVMTVREVSADILRHPVDRMLRAWNWKAAALSATWRGSIFLAVNLGQGVASAAHAFVADALFRVPLSGIFAALTEALRTAEPAWAACLAIAGVLPVVGHAIEFVVHWAAATPELGRSELASIAFSVVSSTFNLF